ncbi:hypothetical protein IAR55_002832 [Kwoniella newhampshirensis]|uniref:Uncharacterized protein n=1 Tax=Kwoniella newhampshirensis TaxID=1651941 RepID=A0AAW0YRY0_9TREE
MSTSTSPSVQTRPLPQRALSQSDSVFVDSPVLEHPTGKPSDLSYLIISGGTGANSIAAAFGPSPAFVLPVSDDGGSSSEILRCFGGPSIGDIRSRLIRLITLASNPTSRDEKERAAIYHLMAYRFPAHAAEKEVRELWMEIVEGQSDLWDGIGQDKKECIRAFLVHFQTLCLKRAHKRFSFRNFSLGNGFLTGARDLFGSLPSAIFLFKSIAGVNTGVQVIPVIDTNQTVTIAAQLANSSTLVGQCAISHPTPPPTPITTSPTTPLIAPAPQRTHQVPSLPSKLRNHFRRDSRTFDTPDMSLPPSVRGSPDLNGMAEEEPWAGGNLAYRKGEEETPLEARIERVFYINLYGQEIYPEPNHEFLEALNQRDVLVYSCGSLWTSIVPCLALKGLAASIASSQTLRARVLLLNSVNDRETPEYTASEYISSITGMLGHYDKPKRNRGKESILPGPIWRTSDLISHVVFLEGCGVQVDHEHILAQGVKMIGVPPSVHGAKEGATPMFSNEAVEWAMEKVMGDLHI